MMRPIGFSTGALAPGAVRRAVGMLAGRPVRAVELSALREAELAPLLDAAADLDLGGFDYVSVHAPSSFSALAEADAARLLTRCRELRRPVIVHPDALTETAAWAELGEWLCVENMDKRKPFGRTADELGQVFERLPQATFCFDIGHARQVDPTMTQAALLLRRFSGRLRQLHVSEVTARGKHEAITFTAINAFRKVAHLIPPEVPAVIESPVGPDEIETQVSLTEVALSCKPLPFFFESAADGSKAL